MTSVEVWKASETNTAIDYVCYWWPHLPDMHSSPAIAQSHIREDDGEIESTKKEHLIISHHF